MALLADILLLASLIGAALLCWAAWLIPHDCGSTDPGIPRPVTLLKPLHGDEPRLLDNLASAADQPFAGPVEIICGVAEADDPAIAVIQRLRARRPAADIRLIVDPRQYGANRKVSNLANLFEHARHDLIVFADSDMAVPPDYLATLSATLARPGVGAVTCLYRGRGDAGFWSKLTALGIDLHFLPATLIGRATGLAHPCMGSTIALRRETLAAIGGFAAFADTLADDHAIGAAVRATGLTVMIPDMILVHACAERHLGVLIRQELRWSATVARIDPVGYAGSIVLHPLALSAIAFLLGGPRAVTIGAIAAAVLARTAIAVRIARLDRRRWIARAAFATALIPLRDLLSFVLFLAGFAVRSVDWRGTNIKIGRKGELFARKDHGS